MKTIVDPKTLTFTESEQNRTSDVAERFEDEITNPLVVVEGLGIIDGHNRAALAIEKGWDVPVVTISAETYEKLQAAGYDNMEICFAALMEHDEQDAAIAIVNQFAGAQIDKRGMAAWKLMD